MSFVTFDQRATFTKDRASFNRQQRVGTGRVQAAPSRWTVLRVGSFEHFLVVVIGALLLCLAAALIFKPGRLVSEHASVMAELHPTCSVERDCFIAPALAMRSVGRVADNTVAPETPAPTDGARPERDDLQTALDATAFGRLVVPRSPWSSAAETPVKAALAASTSSHRLSVAMATATEQPKQAAKSTKPAKAAPAKRTSAERHR